MKALAVDPGARTVRVVADHPPPDRRGPREVRLRMLEVGICGTDKEIAAFHYGTPPAGSDYLVLGHESLGEVLEVGPEVEGLGPGDLVVPMVRRPCPHERCLACRRGRPDFCYTGDFTERGIKQAQGFLTEEVVDEVDYLVALPAALRDVGVLVEPLSIAEKAMIQVWDVQERLPWRCRSARERGDALRLRGLVLGAGPVGLLGAMKLLQEGFETTVYSLEPQDSPKAQLVATIGGRYVSARDTPAARLLETIGDVDLVYEAVGASRLAFAVLEVLGPNAVFVFTGVPGRKAPLEVDAATVLRRLVLENQVLLGTVNAGRDAFDAAMRDLQDFRARWPEAVHALITARHPLEDAPALLAGRSHDDRAPAIKQVVRLR